MPAVFPPNLHPKSTEPARSRLSGQNLALRPYQAEALVRVREAYKRGRRRVLISLPTGTGKTVVFAHFPSALRMQKRLLVLAHRDELIRQAFDKFRAVDPSLRVGVEQAGTHASPDDKVVIASVPTLARAARLQTLRPEDFSIIVVDEAHHAVAPSYRAIFDHFGLFAPSASRFLVGFTATPRRGDKQGLGEVFEEVSYARDLREMIGEHFLVSIRGWRIDTSLSLDQVKIRHGDFVESQLAAVVNTPVRNRLVVKAYGELAAKRRAIVFCVNVAHAQALQEAFADAGVRAAAVWGELSPEVRRATLARFSAGEIDVLTNCNLLTEGFDEPRVDCIIMARPTRSKLLYAQMVGRGTRLHPDKSDVLVIDVADTSRSHQLPRLDGLFNLPANMNLAGGDALVIEQRLERLGREQPWIDSTRILSAADIELAAESIDFFSMGPPEEIAEHTDNTWSAQLGGGYRLSLPRGERVVIEPNLLDTWDIKVQGRTLAQSADAKRAVRAADRWVRKERPDAAKLITQGERWRDQGPTEKQLAYLTRLQVKIPAGLTRGHASVMIAALQARG